ncbi:unnamed protein product [Hyaloperonospora brassicae]|uniref:Ubiquitin-like protease family profile domain-containing protein n=1 Tax=Hyaloperonospora brassicae TaxID=162125 RepID=A0AAV0UWF9_HYABA|nr:unnamed protein product [Hyaloperonospora brassicae]
MNDQREQRRRFGARYHSSTASEQRNSGCFNLRYPNTLELSTVASEHHRRGRRSASTSGYTRCWDDPYGQQFDFSRDGQHEDTTPYAPKYTSSRPKASGQTIRAPGSSIVTTPSTPSDLVDHNFLPPKTHSEFLTKLTKQNTISNRGPGLQSKAFAYSSLEAASAPILMSKAGSRVAAGSSQGVPARAKESVMKGPRVAMGSAEKKAKSGRDACNSSSPVISPYALRDRSKLNPFHCSPTSLLSASLSSQGLATMKKRKLNSEGSASKPIALDSDSESEAVLHFECASNSVETAGDVVKNDDARTDVADNSAEAVADPEDIASQAVARIIDCDAAIGLFQVTVDLYFQSDRMCMRNIRGKYEAWPFEQHYVLELEHLHDVRSHNVSMETAADAQVTVDETDRTSHLQEEASYIALKLPPLDHAAAKDFYDPTSSDVSRGYVIFCPMETASGNSLGNVIGILRGHADIQMIDDKEHAKGYLRALVHQPFSYKPSQLRRRRNSTGEIVGTPESDEECIGDSITVLTYPLPPCTTDVVTIVRRDVSRLNPGRYLNDNIIDYYFKRMMLETFRDHELVQEKVLFLSSHFYSRLRAGKGSTAGARIESGYKNVSTWLSRSSLFTRSIIFIPINKDVHWSLAVILNPGIAGAEPSNEEAFSCIAVLDPLGSYHRKAAIIRNLRAFLRMQWANSEERSSEPEAQSVPEYGVDRVLTLSVETPLQANSYDCGVYVLKFAEVMLKKCLDLGLLAQNEGVICKDVTDKHLEALITSSAFTAEDITATRKQIQRYIEVDTRAYLLRKDKTSAEEVRY